MGSIGDAPKGKGKRPKNKPTLTDANKPVIDALRDNLQGNKIWICKDDTLEVNRKPLEGFVCTPGEGVTAEEHTNVLLSAINNMLSNMEQAETVVEAVMEFDEFEQEGEVHFIYPNLSDRNMWRNVVNYRMPNNFIRRLAEQYSIEQNIAVRWVLEYLKYMYIKSLHPNSWEGLGTLIKRKLGRTWAGRVIRKRKLGKYKKRNINIQKMTLGGEKPYKITFDIIIQDKHNPKSIGPLDITIPAMAMFFAKKKLVEHLKNSIDIHVRDFDIVVEDDDD